MSNDRVSKFAGINTSAASEDDFDAMFQSQQSENKSFRNRKQQRDEDKQQEDRGEVSVTPPEQKKKGRPKKGAMLDLNIGINVFLDKPLHKKLQYAKAETDIGIKDLIYMATDYVMNELFEDGIPNKEGERVIREFKEKMFGNEKLLPQGPLREGLEGFNRVDRVLVVSKNIDHTRASKYAKILSKKLKKPAFVCKTEPEYVYNIKSGEHLQPGAEVVALSAIGQPEQFYRFVEKDYKIIETITFDDHHSYSFDDIKNINATIVTTEKDAVKLAKFETNNIYAMKLKTEFDVESLLGE